MKLSESFFEFIFFLIELSLILGCFGVVLLNDIVSSAFVLGFVFASVSLLYFLLDADFVASAQILIYVGAVNVLIVFAVMLINKKQSDNNFFFWTIGDGITAVICTSIFVYLSNVISNTSWSNIYLVVESNPNEKVISIDNIRRIGSELLTEFIIPFELMSIILLIALIGAITLAKGEQKIGRISENKK
jgi:NAD(P)H-quinone oxidoreductase subunit 6